MSTPDCRIEALKPKHQTIAIVGRPNVGKSALFNLIIGRKMAIVHERSGVTRDRVASMAEYDDRRFMLVDTGGLGIFRDDKVGATEWDDMIRAQLQVALESADKVIFVLDAHEGIRPLDQEVARMLREAEKKIFVVVNKADNQKLAGSIDEFAELGFESIRPISCTQRTGVRDLLHEITLDIQPELERDDVRELRIAVVGRPNVGKSSIINRLLGEERVIVSDIAGTTRDAIDIPFSVDMEGRKYEAALVDTAGLRRTGKVDDVVEYFSTTRTQHAIKRADLVVIVLDAAEPATTQDRKICRMVLDEGKAAIILLNKWDLASAEVKQADLLREMEYELSFMSYAERMTCCAKSGYNLKHLMPKLLMLAEQLDVEYPTSLVNRVVEDALMRLPPPQRKGSLKVYYATCVERRPPTFRLYVNYKERCPANYLTYLRNQFTQAFGIYGMPVIVDLRNRKREDSKREFVPKAKAKLLGASAKAKKKQEQGKRKGPKKGKGSPRKKR